MPEFQVGDIVTVTGDTASFRHGFADDTEVRLIKPGTWGVKGDGWACTSTSDPSETWNVATRDLESPAPSVEEVEHAIESIIKVLRRSP